MNSSDTSISDATVKVKNWIIQSYNEVKQAVQNMNSFYSSSLMIQLFLRRVVEIYFIEGCYDKVGLYKTMVVSSVSSIDSSN